MSNTIRPLAIAALTAVSLLSALHSMCGPVFAQDLTASSSAGSYGSFMGANHRAGGGTASLSLKIDFQLEESTSPAIIYTISRPAGEKAKFAFICVVNHHYPGDVTDVSGQFRYRLLVTDGDGEVKLASGTGKSSFKMVYSTKVKPTKNAERQESLAICKTSVDLTQGRIFIIDMSDEVPVVHQTDCPLPHPRLDERDCDEQAEKVLADMRESITAGDTNLRLLEMRAPTDEQKSK